MQRQTISLWVMREERKIVEIVEIEGIEEVFCVGTLRYSVKSFCDLATLPD
jgi:hypothetical protein